MTPEARSMALDMGADPTEVESHAARLLTPEDLDGLDLALAMGREHRRGIVEMNPSLVRNTFTWRELGRLMSTLRDADLLTAASRAAEPHCPRSRLRSMLTIVAAQRGTAMPPERPEDDDVVDPFRRSMATYERARAHLEEGLPAVDRIIRIALEVEPLSPVG